MLRRFGRLLEKGISGLCIGGGGLAIVALIGLAIFAFHYNVWKRIGWWVIYLPAGFVVISMLVRRQRKHSGTVGPYSGNPSWANKSFLLLIASAVAILWLMDSGREQKEARAEFVESFQRYELAVENCDSDALCIFREASRVRRYVTKDLLFFDDAGHFLAQNRFLINAALAEYVRETGDTSEVRAVVRGSYLDGRYEIKELLRSLEIEPGDGVDKWADEFISFALQSEPVAGTFMEMRTSLKQVEDAFTDWAAE